MITYYDVSSEGDLISSRGARARGGTRPHARYLAPCSNMPTRQGLLPEKFDSSGRYPGMGR
eukprot:scaffold4448_cov38-Cyclotella_meneghiniana.AAC.2